MRVVGPVDLVPEESVLEQWFKREIDILILDEIRQAIRGQLVYSADEVKDGD